MIQKLVDGYLKQEQERRKGRKRSGLWSPSGFGKCYRSQYWNRKNEPITNPPDERTLRLFKTGSLFHDFVQGFIPNQEKEVKCEKDDILGFADIVTKDTVIDLKSQHSRAFWYMKKETYDIGKEKFNSWLQVSCYAWILKKEYCSLVFISKDDLTIAEYTMPTKKWLSELQVELANLRLIWNKVELPKGEARCYNGKECQYCSYKTKCEELNG